MGCLLAQMPLKDLLPHENVRPSTTACLDPEAGRRSVRRLRRRAGAALRDRRGAISGMFVVSLTAFLGIVGLGTEAGAWYVGKRHGQNAADDAARAGGLMINALGTSCLPSAPSAVTSAAAASAANNGFTGGVTVNCPPMAGSYAGDPSAVEVVITQNPTPIFAGLFVAKVSLVNRAVAKMLAYSNACVLAIDHAAAQGDDTIAGAANVVAPNCNIVANGFDPNAITIQGNGDSVTAYSLVTSGGCNGCSGSNVILTRPASSYQPPTPDPLAAIQNVTLPSFTSCIDVSTISTTATLDPWEKNGKAYSGSTNCKSAGTLKMSSTGGTLNFQPGTYFFYNASIDFEGGTINCPSCSPGSKGVTMIFTGSSAAKIGTIKINGNATATLNAPYTNVFNAAFNGVLFYMDAQALPSNNGCGNAPVSINGNAGSVFTGAMYFPSVNICYSGNMTAGQAIATDCIAIVANNITFTGNTGLALTGCRADGVPYPQPHGAALAE
jgi:Flp pilus assembly protein TadG